MEYPKINTLWKRDEKNKFNIIDGDYSCEEFEVIKQWHVTEKIDGTNIRIFYNPEDEVPITFGGRTDNAQIPTFLLLYLQKTFNEEMFKSVFNGAKKVILFGEGYGAKIQNGGLYRDDAGFILFDVWLNGWWLKQEDVKFTAEKLGISSVPVIGTKMTQTEIIAYVKNQPKSLCANKERVVEGVVVRSNPLMLFRNGKPIMWKLKVKDYQKLKMGA